MFVEGPNRMCTKKPLFLEPIIPKSLCSFIDPEYKTPPCLTSPHPPKLFLSDHLPPHLRPYNMSNDHLFVNDSFTDDFHWSHYGLEPISFAGASPTPPNDASSATSVHAVGAYTASPGANTTDYVSEINANPNGYAHCPSSPELSAGISDWSGSASGSPCVYKLATT